MNSSLEKQGPLHVFLHKLTDTQSHAESGDKNVNDDENVVYSIGNINDSVMHFCRLRMLFHDFKNTLQNIQI